MTDKRRVDRYERIYLQLQDLVQAQSPTLTAAMVTICAVLHHKMPHHSWTGFYYLVSDSEMHIGPYQGPVACQVLKDTGVCLHSARTGQPVVVSNVHEFPGHIACDARAMSEIVLPVMKDDAVIAVLDIDSRELEQFTDDDIAPLVKILELLQPFL